MRVKVTEKLVKVTEKNKLLEALNKLVLKKYSVINIETESQVHYYFSFQKN